MRGWHLTKRVVGLIVLLMPVWSGCAGSPWVPNAAPQTLDFRLSGADGPLQCEASNYRGLWKFSAPGKVTVLPSVGALRVKCQVPDGRSGATSIVQPQGAQVEQIESSRRLGSAVGLGAGTAAGVGVASLLAAPVLVPLVMFAGYVRGGDIGLLVGSVAADRGPDAQPRYPDVLTISVATR